MWKTLLLVAVILPQLCTAQSERNVTTNVLTQQQWRKQVQQAQQELKRELTQVREELKDITAVIDETTAVDCEECQRQKFLGKQWKYPAWSCAEIVERRPDYTNGYYWVHGSQRTRPDLVYCNLQTKFSQGEKGWLRVANFNITDPNQQCPTGFELITNPKPLCIRNVVQSGCSSVHYSSSGTTYRWVCGTVGAYRLKTTDGFFRHNCPHPCTINTPYVDGISITHNRKHVWTFLAQRHHLQHCNVIFGTPPRFAGNSYSCQINTPESFCRQLLDPTTGSLEVRVCRDQDRNDEDIGLELIELYVQ